MSETATCDECGKSYEIGEWPLCPHGRDISGVMTFRPYLDENIGPDPVVISSIAQRRSLMRANQCDFRGKQVGMPGCEV